MSYYPSKGIQLGNEFKKKVNSVFSYNVNFINPKSKNFDKIIKYFTCPKCKLKLHCSDCFRKKNNFKITFMRFCHKCGNIFIYSGRYISEKEFDEAFEFFTKHIYEKRRFIKENVKRPKRHTKKPIRNPTEKNVTKEKSIRDKYRDYQKRK